MVSANTRLDRPDNVRRSGVRRSTDRSTTTRSGRHRCRNQQNRQRSKLMPDSQGRQTLSEWDAANRPRSEQTKRQPPTNEVIRGRVAAARAWGDVAGRECLHTGRPSRDQIMNVLHAWHEILQMVETADNENN